MNRFGILTATVGLSALMMAGCNNPANTNISVNTNRAMNTNMSNANANMMNSNMSNANMTNANNTASTTSVDKFLTDATQGGLMEIALGKLAATKAQSPEVKAFGQKMVADHGKAGDEIKAIAAKKKITLPTEMAGGAKETIDRLSKLSGAEFDKEYVKLMVDDHDADLEAFEDQQDSDDADVKAFANKYTPIIKSHYDTIKAINDKMK